MNESRQNIEVLKLRKSNTMTFEESISDVRLFIDDVEELLSLISAVKDVKIKIKANGKFELDHISELDQLNKIESLNIDSEVEFSSVVKIRCDKRKVTISSGYDDGSWAVAARCFQIIRETKRHRFIIARLSVVVLWFVVWFNVAPKIVADSNAILGLGWIATLLAMFSWIWIGSPVVVPKRRKDYKPFLKRNGEEIAKGVIIAVLSAGLIGPISYMWGKASADKASAPTSQPVSKPSSKP